MKKILFAVLLVVATNVKAVETIRFQCDSSPVAGIHLFDAIGVVVLDDQKKATGVVTLVTQKAGAVQSTQIFENIKIEGFLKHFEAGKVTTEAFDQLVLTTDEPYVRSLNLLLDIKTKVSSRTLSIDNFSYRSNCRTLVD